MVDSFNRSRETYHPESIERVFNPNLMFDEVHVVSMYDSQKYSGDEYSTLRIHPVPAFGRRLGILSILLYTIKVHKIINSLIGKNDINLLVHQWGVPTTIALPMVLSARRKRIPSVVTLQNDYEMLFRMEGSVLYRAGVYDAIMKFILKNCSMIRSISDYIMNYALKRGIPRKKMVLIPLIMQGIKKFERVPGKDEMERAMDEIGAGDSVGRDLVIMSASRLKKQKNIPNMIMAFSKALEQHKDMVFILLGKGPLEKELKELVRELGIEDRVLFPGHVPLERLVCIYHSSDIFLFPTFFEGRPQVVIQAIFAGLPVICSDYGAVTEIVRNGKDGIWVNPSDVDEISKAILKLAGDHKLRERLSRHEGYPEDEFSIKRINDMEEKLYRKAMSGNF